MGQRVHRYPRTLQGNGPVGCPFKKAFQPPIANVLLCGAVRMQFQIKARFAVQQGCVSLRHFPAGNQFHPPLLQQFHAAKKTFRVQQQVLIARDSLFRRGIQLPADQPLDHHRPDSLDEQILIYRSKRLGSADLCRRLPHGLPAHFPPKFLRLGLKFRQSACCSVNHRQHHLLRCQHEQRLPF